MGNIGVIEMIYRRRENPMPTRYKMPAVMIMLILLTGCGRTEPTAMPIPLTDLPDPTPTPQGTGIVARILLTYDNLM
jgi:hypothetical protein